MFLSPTRLHKSNVCENIYFLSQRTHTNRKLPNLFVLIYLFSTKKSTVGVFFFICKLYLKNSIKLIIFFFFFLRQPGCRFLSLPPFPGIRVFFFRPTCTFFCHLKMSRKSEGVLSSNCGNKRL